MCAVIFQVNAQHISEQQAHDRALQFLNGQSATPVRRAPANCELNAVPVEASSIYAFNCEGGGFVIASGDARALPVLGYSDSGSLDWERMPENMRAWLKQYDDAIATLGDRTDFIDGNPKDEGTAQGSAKMRRAPSDRMPVEPFIKTHWNQYAPYWDETPLYAGPRADLRGQRCLTGCTATAMAQILNYYQWPTTMPDGLPDYNGGADVPGYDYPIDALPPVAFDWDNMLDDYRVWNPETRKYDEVGTERERRAVATLMRYCGQALKTQYNPLGSAAFPTAYQQTYNDCFGYPAALLLRRMHYGIDEWEDIIYGEIAARRPVQYGGESDDCGHSFICDGYDGNGLFHINWGWGGQDDGYFALSVLNPYNNTSAGSGSSGIGFSEVQDAIIYTDPTMEKQPKPESSLFKDSAIYQYRDISVEDENVVVFHYLYGGGDAQKISADYALGTQGEDGAWVPRIMGNPNDSIVCADNFIKVVVDSTAFQPGDSLALYPLLRFRQAGAEWQLVPPLESHVVIGCTDEGSFFINVHEAIVLPECVSISISKGSGRLNERSDLTVILRNDSESDFQGTLIMYPVYYGHVNPDDITDETPVIEGETMECGSYVKAGQESEVTFSFVPQQGGYMQFGLFTYEGFFLGSFELELTNDTLYDYNPYVENKSYFAREDGKWCYHVELCDKAGVEMPYWIPAASLHLKIRTFIDDDVVENVKIDDEIREYLMSLPEKGGKGDYKFTYQVPINIDGDGEYHMESYLVGWFDDNDDNNIVSCNHEYTFLYSNPTAIQGIIPTTATDGTWYTLDGKKLQGEPTEKGVYMNDGKKVYVK